MRLAPRMIQSMEILQMPLLQLEERIAQELESNPTLELTEVEPDADAANAGDAIDDDASGGSDNADANTDSGDGDGESDTVGEGSDFADDIGGADEQRSDDERPMQVDATHGEADFERLETFEGDNPDVIENQYSESAPSDSSDLADRRTANRLDGEPDAKAEALANTASRSASLAEQLQEQWLLADVDDALRKAGEQIIGFIEDDGYLRTPLSTILERMPPGEPRPDAEAMERALHAVQLLLDPPGVAARDTRECLLLQVGALIEQPGLSPEEQASWALVRRLIDEHLEDLAQNRLPRIAEKAGVPMADIKHAMEKMRLLSLAPGRALVNEAPGLIVPDAIVEYDADQDRYLAYLNETRLPNLRINQEYATLSRDKAAAKDTREFLKKNLSNAAWLIDAVEQRRRTLLRVIRVVVDAQREYFDFGPQALRPLPMTQVAEQLGVHVATVSRAVADKHLLTPRGVVPLRGFFSGGTQTQSGEDVSWDAIKAALKEIIDAEDKSAPLSDDALCTELDKRGIAIARRTVAKYREMLGILASSKRKKLF